MSKPFVKDAVGAFQKSLNPLNRRVWAVTRTCSEKTS